MLAMMPASQSQAVLNRSFNSQEEEKKGPSLQSKLFASATKAEKLAENHNLTLDDIIRHQNTDGYWQEGAIATFAVFLRDGQIEDEDVREAIEDATLVDGVSKDQVYATLLAIFILLEKFSNQEDEWNLLVRKAKTFLRDSGLDKPDKVLRRFNLEVLE